ncbi:hypothetical protein BDP55DRAFT_635198 [Colletotrichum godetiae]|uniref:Uncharacterized protein n=1 Tax=Colletotrichum godetiae TaxID=1209918 RepID=A0AAJ0EPZ5_9PEZI|nr:uncharacterized protein BDP55DRAFT_635198 [Colletotrichum godetiae]KAK1672231.1 hypothetical protein BDP55DRAFT_635198 [Colletotrichum godetiae]
MHVSVIHALVCGTQASIWTSVAVWVYLTYSVFPTAGYVISAQPGPGPRFIDKSPSRLLTYLTTYASYLPTYLPTCFRQRNNHVTTITVTKCSVSSTRLVSDYGGRSVWVNVGGRFPLATNVCRRETSKGELCQFQSQSGPLLERKRSPDTMRNVGAALIPLNLPLLAVLACATLFG